MPQPMTRVLRLAEASLDKARQRQLLEADVAKFIAAVRFSTALMGLRCRKLCITAPVKNVSFKMNPGAPLEGQQPRLC